MQNSSYSEFKKKFLISESLNFKKLLSLHSLKYFIVCH